MKKKIATILCHLFLGSQLLFSEGVLGEEKEVETQHAIVTGGAGFLGSHLCEFLLEKDYKVTCVDDISTGSIDNIEHLLSHDEFTFVKHDVVQPFSISIKVDEIYNLACPASPPHYQKDPVKTVKTSVYGIIHMLDLARENDAKLFQASTSEVYGNPTEHPQKESYFGNVNPNGVRASYDEGKRVTETLCFDYNRMYGTKIKVARIFNTYGPRMNIKDGRVIPNFITQALKNKPVTVYGSGLQTRSLCYVDDLIEGIYAFMQSEDAILGPMNLGSEEEYTVLELAEKIIQMTGSSSKIVYHNLPKDDPTRRRPDTQYAKEVLGWSAKESLENGLEKTILFFQEPY